MSAAPPSTGAGASVVIPTLNAAGHLPSLLPAILGQEPVPPREILLVDSSSADATREVAARYPSVRVVPVNRFSHGGARNLGVGQAAGETVVFLSQDALPADRAWLAQLLAPMADPRVAATFSRQVPKPGANPMERFFLAAHFPEGPWLRMSREESPSLTFQNGIFFSNVSSAVRRTALLAHPFDDSLIMSEDQQFARDVILAGGVVVYQPASVVLHSHNYTLKIVFQRYFDSIYSLTKIFPDHDAGASVNLGRRYVAREMRHMIRRHPLWLPYYFCYTLSKSMGALAGHWAERMPRRLARRLSLHKAYWD